MSPDEQILILEQALAVAERHVVRADRLETALRDAIELVEDYAQYVSPFLLKKWGHADDLARLKSALIDGPEGAGTMGP